MKVGYISRRRSEDGKETFVYREANGTRRIGVKSDTVKVKFLYGTYPYDELVSNTKIFEDSTIILVGEPFITNDELKERLEKWCEWANSCKNREYSFFRDIDEPRKADE